MSAKNDKCYYCKEEKEIGVYCYKYLPDDSIFGSCRSNKNFLVCKECYIRETNKLSELTLKLYNDYNDKDIGVISKDNVVLANIDLNKLLKSVNFLQKEHLKIAAIDEVLEKILGVKNE